MFLGRNFFGGEARDDLQAPVIHPFSPLLNDPVFFVCFGTFLKITSLSGPQELMCFIHFFGAILKKATGGKPWSDRRTSTSSTTLPETNLEPENGSSQKESSIPTINLQVQAVSFREGMLTIFEHLNRMPPPSNKHVFAATSWGSPS